MADTVATPPPRARDLYDQARELIARDGLGPEVQTKIALFLGAAKNVNALFMGVFELQPGFQPLPYQYFHAQFFRELEHVSLLARVTRWAWQPQLYAKGSWLGVPLWKQLVTERPRPRTAPDPRALFSALAYGHAVFSEVRLTPAIPTTTPAAEAFAGALRYMEQENSRMVQTQIRLMKDAFPELPLAEREDLVAQKRAVVGESFRGLMQWVCEP